MKGVEEVVLDGEAEVEVAEKWVLRWCSTT